MSQNKNKVFDVIDPHIRPDMIDSVLEGIKYIKQRKKEEEDYNLAGTDVLEVYANTKISKRRIRGFGSNSFGMLVKRLFKEDNLELTLETELQLIYQKESSNTQNLKHTIYQANSTPPKEKFQLSDNITIRPPTEEEIKHYQEMSHVSRMFAYFVPEKLTIIEWFFSVDLSKGPKFTVRFGGDSETGEKLVEMPVTDKKSDYMEKQRKQYELMNACFQLGGKGNFVPVFIQEEDINPYTLGHKPEYIDVSDLTGKRRIGINFSNHKIVEKIQAFYSKLSNFVTKDIGPIIIATSRLLSIRSSTKNILDKYIDASILLEALLLPGIEGELKFRTSLRAALILGENEEESNNVFDVIKEAYDIRSKIVHGSAKEIEIKKAAPQFLFQMCYHIFLRCLDIYDPDSYSKEGRYNRNHSQIFNLIDRSVFRIPKKPIEDVLGLRFAFHETLRKLEEK